MRIACLIAVGLASAPAGAETTEQKPIVGFRVRGDTKLRERTLGFLAHIHIGDLVSARAIPTITAALVSSELFEKVEVTLEPAPGGYLVVATLVDKLSWFAAPTLYLLGERRAVGAGFIENNLSGLNQKLLFYLQYGSHESILFGTYLDPSVSGTQFSWRFDIYGYRRQIDEYANPTDDPTNDTILRTTEASYLGLGFLVGFAIRWWLVADLRLRGGYMAFDDAHAPDDAPLPLPQDDGWDVSTQARLTLDARHYEFGVRWGPYVQFLAETTIPGLDDYDYSIFAFRAFYAWRLFEEHQLEVRLSGGLGRNLPIQDDLLLGGASDLRGYTVDRFRGDTRAFGRVEYSVPIYKYKMFAFRAVTFWDSGFIGRYRPRKDVLEGGDRSFFYPNQAAGKHWFRNDVGAGFRVYVKSVVLPLLGVDVAYGIEAEEPALYFQLGLVEF